MAWPGQGWNPIHGADQGPPPPGVGYNRLPQAPVPVPAPNQPQSPPPAYHYPVAAPPQFAYPQPQVYYHQPQVVWPAPTYDPRHPPASNNPNNTTIPGIHFSNPTGGIGLPPGYDYLFPSEHTTIHCLKSTAPPWHTNTIHAWDPKNFSKVMVPVNTTVDEFLKRMGCDNKEPKLNVVHEVVEKGNGGWSKGLSINGADKDRVKKKIGEFGWDKTRTGRPGERQVVWVWLTKD